MRTFQQFLEAYRSSAMNWNIQPNAVNSAPQEVVYHKDIGLPNNFQQPVPGTKLNYSPHSKDRIEQKGLRAPLTLPSVFDIIEVAMVGQKVIKWVLRWRMDASTDIVLVLQPDGWVRTAWPNAHSDTHGTLNRSKYAGRPSF